MLSGGFFRLGFGVGLGASDLELTATGGSRRELYELMKSSALGESPRRFLRCSAAASLGRVEV